jgi:hypothetical protein
MTSEITGSKPETFDSDAHDQETKKAYYHLLDDELVHKLRKYFRVEDDHDVLLRYLKRRKVPNTTPNDV